MYYTDCWETSSAEILPDNVIPGLYISGADAAENVQGLKATRISHILSLCGASPTFPQDFQYLVFRDIIDAPWQDMISYLPNCVQFIERGLAEGGGVLVHCAAGVSRSATVVIAFIMYKEKISFDEAFRIVKKRRSCISPNFGFRAQLKMWEEMKFSLEGTTKAHRCYKMRYLADQLRKTGCTDSIEYAATPTDLTCDSYTCGQCKQILFSHENIIEHEKGDGFVGLRSSTSEPIDCNAYFVEPILWMKGIEKCSGDLVCPGCSVSVGRWGWQETQCSCRTRVYPFIRIDKLRVERHTSKETNTDRVGFPVAHAAE